MMNLKLLSLAFISVNLALCASEKPLASPKLSRKQDVRSQIAKVSKQMEASIELVQKQDPTISRLASQGIEAIQTIREVMQKKDVKVGTEFLQNLTDTESMLHLGTSMKDKTKQQDALVNLTLMAKAVETSKSLDDCPVQVVGLSGETKIENLIITYVLYGYRNDSTQYKEVSDRTTWTNTMGPGHYVMWLKREELLPNGRKKYVAGTSKEVSIPEGTTKPQTIKLEAP